MRSDLIGISSLYRNAQLVPDFINEVRLHMAIRTETEEQAKVIGREIEALYTNGPAAGGGARSSVTRVISVASVLIAEEFVKPELIWFGGM
jgi:hypothetical protein